MIDSRTRRRKGRRALLIAVMVIGCALALAGCGQPDASLAPEVDAVGADPTGRIVFVSDGQLAVWENGSIRTLTRFEDGTRAASPAFSTGGDRIAYARQGEGFSELVVADADGNPLFDVTEHEPSEEAHGEDWALNAAWALDPDWAPNDNELIYVSDFDGTDAFSDPLSLWYVEDLKNLTRIPPYVLPTSLAMELSQEDPSFSPEGDAVAFTVRQIVSDTLRNTEIWVLDLESAAYEPLVTHPDGAYDPVWSPDGENVAYIQRDGEANDVWIAPVDGGDPYRLTSIGTCVEPAWSPDGRFIAFLALDGSSFEARVIELTENTDRTLTASEPRALFDSDAIDAPSGLSWAMP